MKKTYIACVGCIVPPGSVQLQIFVQLLHDQSLEALNLKVVQF